MTLRIQVHDVGHGQAVHLFTPAGETIVIDLGGSTEYSPLEALRAQTDTIDSLIITHPHGDHIDEFLLLDDLKFKVRQMWRPNWLPKDEVIKQNKSPYSDYTDKLNAYFKMSDGCVPITGGEVGDPAVSGGVSIKKFSSKDCGVSNINNHSGVVVIEYHGVTVVIPGDNEAPSWNSLLKQPNFVKAMGKMNVFMASHHGRASGYSVDIFKRKPNLCIVSDGPVKETDVTANYSNHAKGWDVLKRSTKEEENRSCITTRSDGHIDMRIGKSGDGGYLAVHVE